MAVSEKDRAMALARCLKVGVIDLSYVAAWADERVAAQATPDWSICELSLVVGKDKSQAHDLLLAVPGDAEPHATCREVLRILVETLTAEDIRHNFWRVWRFLRDLDKEVHQPDIQELCDSVQSKHIFVGHEDAITELIEGLQRLDPDASPPGVDDP